MALLSWRGKPHWRHNLDDSSREKTYPLGVTHVCVYGDYTQDDSKMKNTAHPPPSPELGKWSVCVYLLEWFLVWIYHLLKTFEGFVYSCSQAINFMNSSRMHTAHSLLYRVVFVRGSLPRRVSGGVFVQEGVIAKGVSVRGTPLLPFHGETEACENITCPKLRLRAVMNRWTP